MNEMNFYTLNEEQYEIADKANREAVAKANQEIAKKAGQDYLDQNFASAILVTLTGAAVSTDMVSHIEHEVQCKISGVPNPETVTVSSYGSMLIPDSDIEIAGTVANLCDPRYGSKKFKAYKGVTYCLSYSEPVRALYFRDSDTQETLVADSGEFITYTPDKTRNIRMQVQVKEGEPKIQGVIFSVGTSRPNNRNYVVPVSFRPDSSGKAIIKSVSPGMTILADNPGVTIEATYNADTKKYIDKKFTELQAAILSTGGNV